MTKGIIYFLLIVLFTIGATFKFSASHEKMPIGCDEFGYLNLSKSISEGNAFNSVGSGPWLNGLLDTLRKNGISENEIMFMVTPHAYHVLPGTSKIINQYQPATSAILSIISIAYRNALFPSIGILLLMLIPFLIALKFSKTNFTLFDLFFPWLVYISLVSAPFTTEFARVNSLLFTFGFLIGGGMLLKKEPLTACFLIALTVNFRIVNALMILPVLLFIPFRKINNKSDFYFNCKILFITGGVCFLAVMPLLYYNYNLLGNPFGMTYASGDTAIATASSLKINIAYYLGFDKRWLIFHLILTSILLIFMLAGKIDLKNFLRLIIFAFINYLFFLFHEVKTDYYTYASSMVITGYILFMLLEIKLTGKYRVAFIILMLLPGMVATIAGVKRFNKTTHSSFLESKAIYSSLCEFDIVWGDMYSGTTEYVCNNNGLRYGLSTFRARTMAIKYLKEHHYTQIILVDDNLINYKTILNELAAIKIISVTKKVAVVGNIIIIK